MNHLTLTVSKRKDFLLALLRTGSPTCAARSAGVSRETCYTRKGSDPAFCAAWVSVQAAYKSRMGLIGSRKGCSTNKHDDSGRMTAAEYDVAVAAGRIKPYKGYLGAMATHRTD